VTEDAMEDVLELAGKLMALGSSPNEHEAAVAAAKLQTLMVKHNLSIETVERRSEKRHTRGKDRVIKEESKEEKKSRYQQQEWRIRLAQVVGRTSMVRALASGHFTYGFTCQFVGYPEDVAVARMTFDFLEAELWRHAKRFEKELWQQLQYIRRMSIEDIRGDIHPSVQMQSWLLGATESIAQTLEREYEERKSMTGVNALIVVRENDIREALGETERKAMDPNDLAKWRIKGDEFGRPVSATTHLAGGPNRWTWCNTTALGIYAIDYDKYIHVDVRPCGLCLMALNAIRKEMGTQTAKPGYAEGVMAGKSIGTTPRVNGGPLRIGDEE